MLYLLNGPPRSGKNTIGAAVARLATPCLGGELGAELKERAHAAYRLTDLSGRPHPYDWYESKKDEVLGEFWGITPRQAYIAFHEQYWKPVHGPEVLGEMLLERLQAEWPPLDRSMNLVVTDAGSAPECLPLVRFFGADNTTLISVSRPQAVWNDNRVPFDLPGVRKVSISNDGSLSRLPALLKTSLPELTKRA